MQSQINKLDTIDGTNTRIEKTAVTDLELVVKQKFASNKFIYNNQILELDKMNEWYENLCDTFKNNNLRHVNKIYIDKADADLDIFINKLINSHFLDDTAHLINSALKIKDNVNKIWALVEYCRFLKKTDIEIFDQNNLLNVYLNLIQFNLTNLLNNTEKGFGYLYLADYYYESLNIDKALDCYLRAQRFFMKEKSYKYYGIVTEKIGDLMNNANYFGNTFYPGYYEEAFKNYNFYNTAEIFTDIVSAKLFNNNISEYIVAQSKNASEPFLLSSFINKLGEFDFEKNSQPELLCEILIASQKLMYHLGYRYEAKNISKMLFIVACKNANKFSMLNYALYALKNIPDWSWIITKNYTLEIAYLIKFGIRINSPFQQANGVLTLIEYTLHDNENIAVPFFETFDKMKSKDIFTTEENDLLSEKYSNLKLAFFKKQLKDNKNVNYDSLDKYELIVKKFDEIKRLRQFNLYSKTSSEAILTINEQKNKIKNAKTSNENMALGILIAVIILVIISYLFYIDRSKKNKRITKLEKYIALAKSSVAYLDQHYVFNLLLALPNILDSFNSKEKKDEYVTCLNKLFSKIRLYTKIENWKQENFIPLGLEIDNIKLLVKLENLRNNNSDISLVVDQKFENDFSGVKIPPMCIFGIVQNSIEYGFVNTQINKEIKIWKGGSSYFSILIKDNGEKSKDILTVHKRSSLNEFKNLFEAINVIGNTDKFVLQDGYKLDTGGYATKIQIY